MCIFAKQLQYVLNSHQMNFGKLHNISVQHNAYDEKRVSPMQIKRLQRATHDCNISATLSPQELEAVQKALSFTEEEIRRLRAALAAESVLRFLSDRIEQVKAIQVSEIFFHLLFDADDSAFVASRNRMLTDIRGDEGNLTQTPTAEQNTPHDLEQIFEAYEHAVLWLNTARITQNTILRQGYLAMIASLLTQTQAVLDYPPASIYGTPQLAEWRQMVIQALTEMYEIEAM
jgi:hypothetical protein